jgi:hypothetical protein
LPKISEKIASLHLAAWNIVAIILCLGWGLTMAASTAFEKGFKAMNSTLIHDWLMSQDGNSHLLKIWFIVLCLLMAFLGINLIFCTWEKIFRIIRLKFNGPKFYMLIVHALFGFVALFHFGGFMLGYEQNNIQLGEGMRYSLENDYEIKVNNIHFVSDSSVLEKEYRNITKDEFDYKKNYAEVVLSRKGKELLKDNIYILSPCKYGDVRITLRSFITPADNDNKQQSEKTTPWINLTATRNPALTIFLTLYPLMLLGIFIHLLLTWGLSKNSTS